MKSIDEILKNYKEYEVPLDDRFGVRFAAFLTVEQMEKVVGVSFRDPEAAKKHVPKKWTEDNVLEQLQQDVAFGFEKALNQRGISAGLMYEVVKSWCKVLENGLDSIYYTMYGLPLFKAVAVKYGFDNPIGDDEGTEYKYGE